MSGKLPRTGGVYAIYSACNGRWYFGSAINLRERKNDHWSALNRDDPDNPHGNDHLQKAWRKYGEDAFEFSVVEECSGDQLLIREQYYLDLNFLNPDPYNMCRIAGSWLGHKHTPEAKAKISEALTGREFTAEHRERLRQSATGRKMPPEVIAKTVAANTGRKDTEETKAKKREARKGRKLSDEHKANIGAANRGRVHTDEARENMRAAQTGKKDTDETRAKKSAAQKVRQAREREAKAASDA